jgi:fluoroacetyl-CoA thioesterase
MKPGSTNRGKQFVDKLKPGLKGTAEIIVGTSDTAPRVGSGAIKVMATPVMINLMEAAALDCAEPHLDDGMQSLGTHLNVSHIAATPTGMRVTATAILNKIDGRTLEFAVSAEDEEGLIGEGTHTRVVVNAERFEQRNREKAQRSRTN